ncbi:MAG: hypothetical protein K9K64_05220 [Desulfohalobiaceae bacterium]|nr:hypothetical protein [Desulfohalobiaceae bacterium]
MSNEVLIAIVIFLAFLALILAFYVIKFGIVGTVRLFAWALDRADFFGVMIMLLFYIIFFPVMACISVVFGMVASVEKD